jgi:Fe-S cluster biogenesis protein NfuA
VSALVAEADARLAALERLEPGARAVAYAAVQGLAELYGEGLARIAGGLERWGNGGARANGANGAGSMVASGPLESLLEDELIAHLLILHDLHPLDLAARVERALDEARPYLRSHGGDAEVAGIEDGVVWLRLSGSCHGCPGSAATLRDAVEEAVRRLAPEIERVEEEGANTKLVQLERRGV